MREIIAAGLAELGLSDQVPQEAPEQLAEYGRLLLEQIYYAERVGRCIRYYCAGKTVDSVTLRTSFREAAAPLLADGRFCLCGASYLFNLQHVAGVEARSAVLDSGGLLFRSDFSAGQ